MWHVSLPELIRTIETQAHLTQNTVISAPDATPFLDYRGRVHGRAISAATVPE